MADHQNSRDTARLLNAGSGDMQPVKKGAPANPNYGTDLVASDQHLQQLQRVLKDSRLPQSLLHRLAIDSFPSAGSGASYCRVNNYTQLAMQKPNSSYFGNAIACCLCRWGTLIQEGEVGVVRRDAEYSLLGEGYHSYVNFGTELIGHHRLNVMDVPVTYGACGFVVISEGRIGVLQDGAEYRILAPGLYQWNSPTVRFISSEDTKREKVSLGPYTLITVPDGHVCTSFNNGDLVVLGWNGAGGSEGVRTSSRTFFLNDPKWIVGNYLPTQTQTDKLEANDLLTKDNVEILMVAMSQWRIMDPWLAVQRCGETMAKIQDKVNQIVRATIARIVASTSIGAGPVSGGVTKPIVQAQVVGGNENGGGHSADGLAQLMQSDAANHHMAQLRDNAEQMGIEVIAIFVPEKRMKNSDIRAQVASQAVIGIQAEAERSAADATAYATVKRATAEAESIQLLAKAHADAGAKLGDPTTTAARLALTEVTAKSLANAKVTLFSGAPGNMPFLLTDSIK